MTRNYIIVSGEIFLGWEKGYRWQIYHSHPKEHPSSVPPEDPYGWEVEPDGRCFECHNVLPTKELYKARAVLALLELKR